MDNKVSVLIPAYNREKFIELTIKSVLDQSYQNIEIIVYDDGSKDNTVEKIKSIKDKRLKLYIGETNRGVGYARNFLMEKATGEYLCWLDSDDLLSVDRITKCINYINEHSVDIVYSKIQWFSGLEIINKKNSATISSNES